LQFPLAASEAQYLCLSMSGGIAKAAKGMLMAKNSQYFMMLVKLNYEKGFCVKYKQNSKSSYTDV